MKYSLVLEESWKKLLRDCYSGRFRPLEEADIQSYLYHLCLKKIKDPSKIHVEWQKKGKFIDIMFGNGKLPVEIKWSFSRKSESLNKTIIRRWKKDVFKLSRRSFQLLGRKPTMIIFFTPSNRFCPLREKYIPKGQKDDIRKFVADARSYGIKVLPLYL